MVDDKKDEEGGEAPAPRSWKRSGQPDPNFGRPERRIKVEDQRPRLKGASLGMRAKLLIALGAIIFLVMLFERTVNNSGWADSKREYNDKRR